VGIVLPYRRIRGKYSENMWKVFEHTVHEEYTTKLEKFAIHKFVSDDEEIIETY
jgi:hypothetical protein